MRYDSKSTDAVCRRLLFFYRIAAGYALYLILRRSKTMQRLGWTLQGVGILQKIDQLI